jgi:hypothetical protein
LDLRERKSIRAASVLGNAGRETNARLQIRRLPEPLSRNFVIGAISNRRSDKTRALFHSLTSITIDLMFKVFRSAPPTA